MNLLRLKAAAVSLLLLATFLGIWHVATLSGPAAAPGSALSPEQAEYAKMMGKEVGSTKTTGFPSLGQVGAAFVKQLSHPFYDNGPNDKGIAIQLALSTDMLGLQASDLNLVTAALVTVALVLPRLRRGGAA